MDNELDRLIALISKLPSIGKRSAKRIALHLLKNKNTLMLQLASSMKEAAEIIQKCKNCGNFDVKEICNICSNEERDRKTACIVENVEDLWAIERSNIYKGLYHVLGGTLSAIDGIGPDELNITSLEEKISRGKIEEVIIATNATIDGQTTAHFVANKIKDSGVKTSRLAFGIPLGGELEYLDEGTLLTALETRREI